MWFRELSNLKVKSRKLKGPSFQEATLNSANRIIMMWSSNKIIITTFYRSNLHSPIIKQTRFTEPGSNPVPDLGSIQIQSRGLNNSSSKILDTLSETPWVKSVSIQFRKDLPRLFKDLHLDSSVPLWFLKVIGQSAITTVSSMRTISWCRESSAQTHSRWVSVTTPKPKNLTYRRVLTKTRSSSRAHLGC